MRLTGKEAVHLTYCTNIHPGETWAEVRSNLDRHVLAVRRGVAPDVPFGIGLRLSDLAARELSEPAALEELTAFLARNDLYVFTINGFPYGPFHGQPVKEEVYRPDWGEDERLTYTDRLATLLAELLPTEPRMQGTISTVPIAFAQRVQSEDDLRGMTARLVSHVAQLFRLKEQTGKHLWLTIEPEPCCYLETVDETVRFFEERLFSSAAVRQLATEAGVTESASRDLLRGHLGVCFDACHMAVEFEEPTAALAAFDRAGIAIPKVQISAGLEVEFSGDPISDGGLIRELREFADSVYLHQVVERSAGGIRRFLDLPQALQAAEASDLPREWRIHFHVPLFRQHLGAFSSTQAYLTELLPLLLARPGECHWEVETYTWDVLPEEFRRDRVDEAVTREMRWVIDQTRRWAGERT